MTEHEKAVHIIKSIVCSSGGLLTPKDYICIKDMSEKLDADILESDLVIEEMKNSAQKIEEYIYG